MIFMRLFLWLTNWFFPGPITGIAHDDEEMEEEDEMIMGANP